MLLETAMELARMELARGEGQAGGGKPNGAVEGLKSAVGSAPAGAQATDWDTVLRVVNGEFDGVCAAATLPTFAQRSAAAKKVDEHIRVLRESSFDTLDNPDRTKHVHVSLRGNMLFLGVANAAYERSLMVADLDQVAFALAAYKAENGAYPETLAALVPGYLKAVPADRFNDQPLHYKAGADGFVVYSVGDDMEDNGGSETRDKDGHEDLVIRVGK